MINENALIRIKDELKDLRRIGFSKMENDFGALGLLTLMGFNDKTPFPQIISGLIVLIKTYSRDKVDAELLLMSLGLLKGYEQITDVGDRRLEYYYNGYPADESERPKDFLAKREEKAIIEFVNKILVAENLSSTLANIPTQIDLPLAQYPDKARWVNVGRVTFRNINFPERNIFFLGREKIINDLHNVFVTHKNGLCLQVLSGIGGVGKSQIAIKYAYEYEQIDFDTMWWTVAESNESILESISEFAVRKGLAKSNDDAIIKQSSFVKWFETHTNWLLIFDNVEDYEVIKPIIPTRCSYNGRIIITTRLFTGKYSRFIYVDVYDKDTEAIPYMLNRTGSNDRASAEILVTRLGFLPLALEQAAAYIVAWSDVDLNKYLLLLHEYGMDVFEEETANYKNTVKTIWKISMNKLSMKALSLISLCSYFAPDAIDPSYFEGTDEDVIDIPEEFKKDDDCSSLGLMYSLRHKLKRRRLISELVKYSLVKYENGFLYMHRLLQEVIRDGIEDVRDGNILFHSLIAAGNLSDKMWVKMAVACDVYADTIHYDKYHTYFIMANGNEITDEYANSDCYDNEEDLYSGFDLSQNHYDQEYVVRNLSHIAFVSFYWEKQFLKKKLNDTLSLIYAQKCLSILVPCKA